MTPGTSVYLQESPLFNRSTALSVIDYRAGINAVSEEDLKNAMRKALCRSEVSFRSEEQKEALRTIIFDEQKTALIVVLPTGGGKSLLFTAPACLDNPGVTIVVMPYRALLDNLLATANKAKIDCMEYRPGEQNPAALVFISADFVSGSQFLSKIPDGIQSLYPILLLVTEATQSRVYVSLAIVSHTLYPILYYTPFPRSDTLQNF
jgi:superfamily II DNA or RNA helicase